MTPEERELLLKTAVALSFMIAKEIPGFTVDPDYNCTDGKLAILEGLNEAITNVEKANAGPKN